MNAVKLLMCFASVSLVVGQIAYTQPIVSTPAYTYPTMQPVPLVDYTSYAPQSMYPEYSGVSLYSHPMQGAIPAPRSLSDNKAVAFQKNARKTHKVYKHKRRMTSLHRVHRKLKKTQRKTPDRSLQLKKSKRWNRVASRKMADVNIKQRQVLLLFKSFIDELHHHHFNSLNQFESFYSSYFQENQSFFMHNFLHIFEDNFMSNRKHNFVWSRIQTQIAKSLLMVSMSDYNPSSNVDSSFGVPTIDFSSPSEIFKFLATLINKQNNALRAGLRPGNQFKLPDDLPDKFALLAVLYRAEHILYKESDPEGRQKVLMELEPYGIDSYDTFKKSIDDLSRYFKALIRYLKSFKSQKKPIKEVTNSISDMLRRIKNERLGRFFTEYLKNFNSLKIEGGTPTPHQKQTLKYLIEQLINDQGNDQFLSSMFKVLKNTKPLQGINSDRSPKSIIPPEIFIQILENRIKDPSIKFLVVFYFEWIFGHIKNIEDFVFRDFPNITDKLKFDYKRFLNSLLNHFDTHSFRKFNQALFGLSKQIDALLESQNADMDKFGPIYAKLLFKILSQYYFIVGVPEYLQFANTYMIPREHYPYNFKMALVRSTINPEQPQNQDSWMNDNIGQIEAPSPFKPVSLDSKLDDIINNLNKYLDIIKNRQYGSEQERAEILKLVRQVLDSEVPEILSKTQIKKPFNLPSPIDTFKPVPPTELQAKVTIQGVPKGKVFHITIKLLDRAAVITKIFEQLFKYTSKEQNSRLLTLFSTLLHFKIKDTVISQKLDHLYEAIDVYTHELDKLFVAEDHELLKDVWKILILFFSRNCHIKLYKLLSDRIAVANTQLRNEIDMYAKMKIIIRNFIVFLIKNRKFDFKKDCAAVMEVILRSKKISQKIIKKALFLHNFKKILNESTDPGNQIGDKEESIKKYAIINRLVKFALKHHDLGKMLHPGRKPEQKKEEEKPIGRPVIPPVNEKPIGPPVIPPVEEKHIGRPVIPPVKDKVDPKKITFVRKVIKNFFQYFKKKNHIRDFGKTLYFGIPSKDLDSFKIMYTKYQKTPHVTFFEKHPRMYLTLQKLLLKSFSLPPKTPEEPKEKYIEFVKKVIQKTGFHSNIKKPNRNHSLSKILYKPSPSLLKTFHLLYTKYRNAHSFFMDRNNQTYLMKLKKVLFKKVPNQSSPETPNSPESPTFTKSEVKFVQKLLNLFIKNTPYYENRTPFKKTQTRIFLKKLPVLKAGFFKRIYRRYPKITQFLKKGPVTRLENILSKTLYKRKRAGGCKCTAKCYRIVDGQKIELTDEERKKLIGDDFKCGGPGDQGFKWLNGQGDENKPGYGCACGCGGKGTVQLNDHPVFNLTFDFSNAVEAQRFKQSLMDPEVVERIANTNSINLPALKAKYGSSEPGRTFDFVYKSNPQRGQAISSGQPTEASNPDYQQGRIQLRRAPNYSGTEDTSSKSSKNKRSDFEIENSDEEKSDFEMFMKNQAQKPKAEDYSDMFEDGNEENEKTQQLPIQQLLNQNQVENVEEAYNPLNVFKKMMFQSNKNRSQNSNNYANALSRSSRGSQKDAEFLANLAKDESNLYAKVFGSHEENVNKINPGVRVRHGITNYREQQDNINAAEENYLKYIAAMQAKAGIQGRTNIGGNDTDYDSVGTIQNAFRQREQGIELANVAAPYYLIRKLMNQNRINAYNDESIGRMNPDRYLAVKPQPAQSETQNATKPTEMV